MLDLLVEDKAIRAEGVVSLQLRRLGGEPLPEWSPGAHVDLLIDGVEARQYSLCGDPRERDRWRLGILREPQGRGSSRYVHDTLSAGDVVRADGPRNHFELVPSPHYLFIAGGIGITPLLPMVAAVERAGADWRLAYGGRSRASMAFVEELGRYGSRVAIRPQDEVGLLDLEALFADLDEDALIYCCGPEPLLEAVESLAAGRPAGTLHVERFEAKPQPAGVAAESIEVVLARSGSTVSVDSDQSILKAVQEAGVPVLCSCTEGVCGTCETEVLEGLPDHRDSILSEEERAAGDCMMICVSRALTPRLVLAL